MLSPTGGNSLNRRHYTVGTPSEEVGVELIQGRGAPLGRHGRTNIEKGSRARAHQTASTPMGIRWAGTPLMVREFAYAESKAW